MADHLVLHKDTGGAVKPGRGRRLGSCPATFHSKKPCPRASSRKKRCSGRFFLIKKQSSQRPKPYSLRISTSSLIAKYSRRCLRWWRMKAPSISSRSVRNCGAATGRILGEERLTWRHSRMDCPAPGARTTGSSSRTRRHGSTTDNGRTASNPTRLKDRCGMSSSANPGRRNRERKTISEVAYGVGRLLRPRAAEGGDPEVENPRSVETRPESVRRAWEPCFDASDQEISHARRAS